MKKVIAVCEIVLGILMPVMAIIGYFPEPELVVEFSCLSNVGPGMSAVIGPAGSFAFFSTRSKLILSLAMLLGRLEIYPILLLFLPRTWRR